MDDGDEPGLVLSHNTSSGSKSGGDKMFSLKKWNAVAMWSWDVECDTCAICRVQVMGESEELTELTWLIVPLKPERPGVWRYSNIVLHFQMRVYDARRKINRRTVLVRPCQH